MPRLRGVVVLRSGVRCLTYRCGILLGFTLSILQKGVVEKRSFYLFDRDLPLPLNPTYVQSNVNTSQQLGLYYGKNRYKEIVVGISRILQRLPKI